MPCTGCVNAGTECVTPVSGRSPAKSLRRSGTQTRLTKRVAAVEKVVQSLGRPGSGTGLVSTLGYTHGADDAELFRNRSGVSMPKDTLENRSSIAEAPRSHDTMQDSPALVIPAGNSRPNTDSDFEKLFVNGGGSRYVNTCLLGVLDREVSSSPRNL